MMIEPPKTTSRVKINWLLILQGWAMLWVVVGHSGLAKTTGDPKWVSVLVSFAYSFHMPLFVLVSGWLFYYTRLSRPKEWVYIKILKDKFNRLIIPGFVFSLLALILKLLFPGDMSRVVDFSFRGIVHGYLYPHENPFAELWFVVVLAELFLLMPLWRFALNKSYTKLLLLLLIFIIANNYHPSRVLCLDRFVGYSFWFYLGILLCEMNIVEKFFVKGRMWLILIGITLYALSTYIFNTNINFFATFGAILFSFGLSLTLDVVYPKALISFRNYTYQIFLMGIFAQIFVKMLNKRIDAPYSIMFVLCVLFGLYMPVLISNLIKIINWKPLSLCVGLKTK